MANINLVNLNDAVYRMLNPAFVWTSGVNNPNPMTTENFSAVNCPLLRNHDRREVVTYKDWVSILAGNPNVTDTRTNRRSRCLALNDTPNFAYLKPWARTFGKPAGPGGKPLAEVKPLDEMFWYYDALDRNIAATVSNTTNASRLFYYYYNSYNGWMFNWAENGLDMQTNNTLHRLEPGVYGACLMSCNRDIGYNIIDTSGALQGDLPFMRCYMGGGWFFQNSIFFVDTEVTLRKWWDAGDHFQGILFRITPPGYWQ